VLILPELNHHLLHLLPLHPFRSRLRLVWELRMTATLNLMKAKKPHPTLVS